jgi:glycerol-3-phosphate dehydrogenase
MQAAEDAGVMVVKNALVSDIERTNEGYVLSTSRGEIIAETVVNSAGLQADEIAKMAGIEKYQVFPCRGDYFNFLSPCSYSKLIYPSKPKNDPGLGVHLTLSLDGRYRLGPDAYYIDAKDDFTTPLNLEAKKKIFMEAARKIFKNIDESMLSYDSCGIRPKLRPPDGSHEVDFVISKDLDGWINLVGIESPGLTSARSIARKVARLI